MVNGCFAYQPYSHLTIKTIYYNGKSNFKERESKRC
ncbi:hypothetical protein J2T02_002467 [Chitinophaga terrae (ex Kim and Jung 2007)]|nr:hypothetical protein [Chitinophaga terrae (ex Kim and Jung 2007)]